MASINPSMASINLQLESEEKDIESLRLTSLVLEALSYCSPANRSTSGDPSMASINPQLESENKERESHRLTSLVLKALSLHYSNHSFEQMQELVSATRGHRSPRNT
ncbi:unnamed protein product [Chrysoparadoxa australica]